MKLTLGCNTFDLHSATIDCALDHRAEVLGDKIFLTHLPDGRRHTYADMNRQTTAFGMGLMKHGVRRGAHVAILMDNCPEQLIAIWGVSRSGLVAIPLNSASKGQLLAYFLGHSDSEAIVVQASLLPRVLEILDKLPGLKHIVTLPDSEAQHAGDDGGTKVPVEVMQSDFQTVLDAGAEATTEQPAVHFDDLAMLMYTSGTTGPSKAIMFSHAQLVYWGTDVAIHHEYTEDDIAYVYLPLFHGNALLGSTMGAFMAGASIALARRFSASRFWSEIKASKATVFNSVGAVTNFLWGLPPSDADRDHAVTRCHLAPVPKFGAEFETRYGMKIMSAFGLTDYCLGTAFNTRSRRDKLGSTGQARQDIEIRVVDEFDRDMPIGHPGEIVLRNQCPWGASLGYYKSPEATLASRRNLWFHTGDRGVMDADGYLWYTDRLKDSIRRRGENISAFEVEEVIRTHPSVADVAVFPVRSELSEDEVGATILLKPDARWVPEAIVEHCNRNLAYFMVPRYLNVIDEMPTTLSQKIEKYRLKTRMEQDLSHVWDREQSTLDLQR